MSLQRLPSRCVLNTPAAPLWGPLAFFSIDLPCGSRRVASWRPRARPESGATEPGSAILMSSRFFKESRWGKSGAHIQPSAPPQPSSQRSRLATCSRAPHSRLPALLHEPSRVRGVSSPDAAARPAAPL